MKRFVGLLLLLAVFAVAALWQSHLFTGFQQAQEYAQARQRGHASELVEAGVPPGWSLVIVGAPSGAEAVAPAPASEVLPPPEGRVSGPELPAPQPQTLGDFELAVQPGQTLSRIFEAQYPGHFDPELVKALATYNGIDDPDRLSVGQSIWLPSLERLEGLRP